MMNQRPLRIGLFGGTFDPFHRMHERLALGFAAHYQLDRLHLLPCGQPYHRAQAPTSAHHRVAMVALAIKSMVQEHTPRTHFLVDETDIQHNPLGYTARTLELIKPSYPDNTIFFLLIGGDSLTQFHTWHRYEAILDAANLVFTDRPNHDTLQNMHPQMKTLWDQAYVDARLFTDTASAFIDTSSASPHNQLKEYSTAVPTCGTISRLSIALSPISATHVRQILALQSRVTYRFCDDVRTEILNYINENDLYL